MGSAEWVGGEFSVVVERPEGVPVIRVQGDLNAAGARALKLEVLQLARRGQARMIVDLHQVPTMDSGAVGVLAGLHHLLREYYGGITLTGLNRRVFRTLCISGMDRAFEMERDERVPN